MIVKTLVITTLICSVSTIKSKPPPPKKTTEDIKKILEEHEHILAKVNQSKPDSTIKFTNYEKPTFIQQPFDNEPKVIPFSLVQEWASKLSETLFHMERRIVRREQLLKGFSDVKMEVRNGTDIVNRMVEVVEDLLRKRTRAAEDIMRKAEELTKDLDFTEFPPEDFKFANSIDIDVFKKKLRPINPDLYPYKPIPPICINTDKVKVKPSKHFDADISFDNTSVHVSAEVFDCEPRVKQHLEWSTRLYSTFRRNLAQDATMNYQYFCSAKGFLRHYPAASWASMFNLAYDQESDIYDCRLRPWYVSASGAPRDILILLDASGSMTNSSNLLIGEQVTLTLLSALTDDDYVNVLRFNVEVESPIGCFNDKLVPANHVNSAAMMAAMYPYRYINTTYMDNVLSYAVQLLQKQRSTPDRPAACQQAIVILTDSVYENLTEYMRKIDPHNRIRLFILWLHDPNGLRDSTEQYANYMTCDRDGYFAELLTPNDVTEQVMRILRVLERPLVAQRKERLTVFSDVYAHVEDPRRGEQLWKDKESQEQMHRYRQLRKNKTKLLSPTQLYKDHMHQESLDKFGFYYEDPDIDYNMLISVSVSVFEHTTFENITIKLQEEKQRNSTRTYPVNRLLGVAGVDIPIEHLKLLLPYHQIGGQTNFLSPLGDGFRKNIIDEAYNVCELGGGGTLFMLDQRGNIVLHDNMKSTFDGDILRPGYRTVDFLDLEQPASDHYPRQYPRDWLKFRKLLLIEEPKGNMTMYGKNIFDHGLRMNSEMREYFWKRILDHYTAVVVLPPYNKHHIVPETSFSKQIAEEALKTLSRTEFAVHPDWLYCRHVERHFDSREAEVLHFIRRRSDEPNFQMNYLRHEFTPLPPTLLKKPYQCDQELMAKLCKEAIATEKWAREHDAPDVTEDCTTCKLGPATAFFASESGLTRWHQYTAMSQHAAPPSGAVWARGPTEPWYKRAAARPDTLIIHAPVTPVTRMRNTFINPPPLGTKHEWLTAARTLGSERGFVGVAGFHFHPQHLADVFNTITKLDYSCTKEESVCPVSCSGPWSCVLVDEGGWIVATNAANGSFDQEYEGEIREHLSTVHPAAMAALVNASVFHRKRVHDYQAVCFFPPPDNAAPMLPSLLRTIWYTVTTLFHATQQIGSLITFMYSIPRALSGTGETAKEKYNRQWKLRRDYARDQFDELFDPRVIINRTVFAACDRYRNVYQLQQSAKSMEALSRTPTPEQLQDCSWPLVGAPVPKTNLILLALYRCSDYKGWMPPTPLYNKMYPKPSPVWDESGRKQSRASVLACQRNLVPLPARLTHHRCYPHDYKQEEGYRQCAPWEPDPDGAPQLHVQNQLLLLIILYLIIPFML